MCAITCGSGKNECDPDGGAPYCADFKTDNVNCGSCGNACGAGTMCSGGTCSTTCGAGLTTCTTGASVSCANTQSDNANCGGCGNLCTGSQSCQAGVCKTFFSGATGAWTTVPAVPLQYGGFSDFSPGSTFFATNFIDSHLFLYDPTPNSWTSKATPPSPFAGGYYSGPAWVGNALYAFGSNDVFRYDIASDTFTSVLSGPTNVGPYAQHAHDDDGNVYAIDASGNLLRFNVAAGTLTTVALSAPLSGPNEPRLAWDSASKRLYGGAQYFAPSFVSIDPATGIVVALPSIPDQQLSDIFCSDRSGHVYANGSVTSATLYQYTISSAAWTLVPNAPPYANRNTGSCTVTSDGWLYYGRGNIARLDLR